MAHPPGVGYNEQAANARREASQRAATVATPAAEPSAAPAAETSAPSPAFSLPDFSSWTLGRPLLVVAVLILGLAFYGRFVKPINLGTVNFSGQTAPTTQAYIDQQNRKVALISDTMPGRIIRTNPAKLGAS